MLINIVSPTAKCTRATTTGERYSGSTLALRKELIVWIDEEFAAHTIAMPCPTAFIAPRLLSRLKVISAFDAQMVEVLLETRENQIYELVENGLSIGTDPEVEFPPGLLIGSHVESGPIVSEISKAIDELPCEWTLDAIMCIADTLDEIVV